jgi:hypothetical protein
MTNTEKIAGTDFTIERFNFETGRWETFEHLGYSKDLEWVREAWRTVLRQDWDGYYRVVSAEGVWLGSAGNPVENVEWSEDRN